MYKSGLNHGTSENQRIGSTLNLFKGNDACLKVNNDHLVKSIFSDEDQEEAEKVTFSTFTAKQRCMYASTNSVWHHSHTAYAPYFSQSN